MYCITRYTSVLIAIALLSQSALAQDTSSSIEFNRDIRPILSEHCFACHGPDKNHREGDLRLDIAPQIVDSDSKDVQPIVPGKPELSELVTRIYSADEIDLMPPPDSHKPLSEEQKETLKKWIEQGAQYQGHWAYVPLKRPEVPNAGTATKSNPIDTFIDSKLADQHLSAAPKADRRTLIRRLYLDLCGLPPSIEQVEAFEHDDSPEAYDRLVDELLSSSAFAEKQTIHWLDAVRYADTVGFHGDQDMPVWPYRDYVLNAFRTNMPFDQFTREQLAGDLLPNPTLEQLTATAFNRLNRMSAEGGVQDKEYRLKYAADRVRTVSMVWLGSTLGCAECHDHKYDPFTTKDFYSLSAYFSDIQEQGFYDQGLDKGDWGPSLEIATDEQRAPIAELNQRIAKLDSKLDQIVGNAADYEARIKELQANKQTGWQTLVPVAASSSEGAILTVNPDGTVVVGGPNPDSDSHTIVLKPGPGTWTSFRLTNDVDESLPGNRVARGWRSFVISEFEVKVSDSEQTLEPVELSVAKADRDSDAYPSEAAIDGDWRTGWACEYGASGQHSLAVHLAAPLQTTESTYVTIRVDQRSAQRHATLGRYRIMGSRLPNASIAVNGLLKDISDAVGKAINERTKEQQDIIQNAANQVARFSSPDSAERTKLLAQRRVLQGSIPRVLVTKRADHPQLVRVLPRGNWMDESGEIVQPATPGFLSSTSKASDASSPDRQSRLDLANWLTGSQNPLTARTMVNRWWQQFFGTGLSKQLEDIGSQGHWPTHPELLDWLASEFMQPNYAAESAHAWDVKHLIRLIVTSEAYQRSSVPDATHLERDQSNQWLARQTPVRLTAEVIRDCALANSGLLAKQFGGPSIRPYQPAGYWLPLNYPKQEYAVSFGDASNRRSVYMHWQRTFLHPSLLAFDAATREECQVARTLSNTPQQAFVLLNDPMFLQMSVALAARGLTEGGTTPTEQISWQFRQVLGRDAQHKELEVLLRQYQEQHDYFGHNTAAARDLLSASPDIAAKYDPIDLAAMTMVSRIVLNLHETITRD